MTCLPQGQAGIHVFVEPCYQQPLPGWAMSFSNKCHVILLKILGQIEKVLNDFYSPPCTFPVRKERVKYIQRKFLFKSSRVNTEVFQFNLTSIKYPLQSSLHSKYSSFNTFKNFASRLKHGVIALLTSGFAYYQWNS